MRNVGGMPHMSEVELKKLQEENNLLWLLIKGVKLGKFRSIKELLADDLDIIKANSVYLSKEGLSERIELSKQYGVLVLGKQDLIEFDNRFKEKTIPIPKGNICMSWRNINFPQNVNVSNAMIVQDNYVFSKELNRDNFYSILDIILPPKSLIPFHISIFTIIEGTKAKNEYRRLLEKIKEIRKNLSIKLTIYNVYKDEFHARRILTNTIFVKSEIGFDIFNRHGARMESDVFYFFPYFFSTDSNGLVENLIEGIRRVEKRGLAYEFNYWGDEHRENRLLSYYNLPVL